MNLEDRSDGLFCCDLIWGNGFWVEWFGRVGGDWVVRMGWLG